MKKLVTIIGFSVLMFFLCTPSLFAQSPNAIPYQGVARNASGSLLSSQSISLRISIHDATASGTVVYKETHTVNTSNLGLFNIVIGTGTPVTGSLASVNWGAASKFIQVELDPAGGSSYTDMGTTQLLSVPYALYAEKANVPGVAGPQGDPGPQGAAGPAPSGTGLVTVNSGVLGTPAALSGDVTTTGGGLVTSLSNTGVTAGTYTKVTVDAKGRVSSGASLSSSDIPSLTSSYVDLTTNQTVGGAKTFSGTVTASSIVKSSGTATQYLMADGSTTNLVREVADEFTATAAQTSFTLSQTKSTNSKVKMYINGIRISNTAYSVSGTTLTYTAANNGSYALVAGDRIQFDYFY